MDASRLLTDDCNVTFSSIVFAYTPIMFHQNLSPSKIHTHARKRHSLKDYRLTPSFLSKSDSAVCLETSTSTGTAGNSQDPSSQSLELTRTSNMNSCADADNFTTRLNLLRSPAPSQAHFRSLSEELQDLTISFADARRLQDLSIGSVPDLTRESSVSTIDTNATASDGGDDERADEDEDDLRSNFSLENAQVLEAHAQTLTRLTPAPLRPVRAPLSPIQESSRKASPVLSSSSTLVEVQHPLHQSPASSGQGFSPYADTTDSSRPLTNSPCERLLFGHMGASLLGATPHRPSPLREVITATAPEDRRLDLESFDPTGQNLLSTPGTSLVPADRMSIDLSLPLHVPVEEFMSPQTDRDGRLRGAKILIAVNSFLAHATTEKREHLADGLMKVFKTHGVNMELSQRSRSTIITAESTPAPADVPSVQSAADSPMAAVGASQFRPETTASTEEIINDWATLSSVSELAAEMDELAAERADIGKRIEQNHEELRDMVASWSQHVTPSPVSSASLANSTPPSSVVKRRLAAAPCTTPDRAASASPSVSPTPINMTKRSSNCGSRRFSDHTFSSLNRSLQTVDVAAPAPRRVTFESKLRMLTPNVIASSPSGNRTEPVAKKPIDTDQENKSCVKPTIPTPLRRSLKAPLTPASRNVQLRRAQEDMASAPLISGMSAPPKPKTRAASAPQPGLKPISEEPREETPEPKRPHREEALRQASRLYKLVKSDQERLGVKSNVQPLKELPREESIAFMARYDEWGAHIISACDKLAAKDGVESDGEEEG